MPGAAVPFQPDGDLVLHRPREDRDRQARPFREVAQTPVRPDVLDHADRDRILPYPDQPGGRAGRPDRDLSGATNRNLTLFGTKLRVTRAAGRARIRAMSIAAALIALSLGGSPAPILVQARPGPPRLALQPPRYAAP